MPCLAIDNAADQPLIIDQSEASIGSKSVFEELIVLFISAKSKCLVMIVTHNAN